MSDLWNLAPRYKPTGPAISALAVLEATGISTADLLLLDSSEIAKRASVLLSNGAPATFSKQSNQVSAVGLRVLADQVAEALVQDVEGNDGTGAARQMQGRAFDNWTTISALDDRIDELLNGGFPTGRVSEVVGESGAGKTQMLITLLLSAQLISPSSSSAIYISTEGALPTQRVKSIIDSHPAFKDLPTKPSLERVHALVVPDLESQDHILKFQLPIAVKRFNAKLVAVDSVAAHYRAEFSGGAKVLRERGEALAGLGALLRKIATDNDCAVVVANQVADRFEPMQPPPPPSTRGSHSPVAIRSRSQPLSSVGPPSSAPSGMSLSAEASKPKPGLTSLDPLAYDHQLRFFSGWNGVFPTDEKASGATLQRIGTQKTPALGLAWSSQIAARIVVKKGGLVQFKEGQLPKRKRWIGVAFSAWCGSTEEDQEGVEFEIWRGGIRAFEVRSHRHNPVAWQLWTPATLSLAATYNRLIFLSIGYSACHWCHVMERESFENDGIAILLNKFFIPIKIDREERPDLDRIYMDYVQATTGGGGWPLNVFITPDLEPVFGGTYFPGPHSHTPPLMMGGEQVGFQDVLRKMVDVWATQEDRCRLSAKDILEQLKGFAEEGTLGEDGEKGVSEGGDVLDIDLLEESYEHFKKMFDKTHGGFSAPPKFATPANLKFLLSLKQSQQPVKDMIGGLDCQNAVDMAVQTLRSMARGGIHDQVGGGFHRYSVTRDWSLPHFEKMLYDNAQLLSVYLDAFLLTRDTEMLEVVKSTAKYLLGPQIHPTENFFYASEDADSAPSLSSREKREGAHYVMTRKELTQVLGEADAEVAAEFFGVSVNGNVRKEDDPHDEFLDQNVLQVARTTASLASEIGMSQEDVEIIIKRARDEVRQWRDDERPKPNVDDKVVAGWNGLAIGALARVSAALNKIDPDLGQEALHAAKQAAKFIMKDMYDRNLKKLKRIWRNGVGDTEAFVDDYAYLIDAFIELYLATFEEVYLRWADEFQETQIKLFYDRQKGGFFCTVPSPDLILRLKSGVDAAEASPNGVSARNLYRLSSMLDDEEYGTLAKRTVQAFEAELLEHPGLFASMMGPVAEGRIGGKVWMASGPSETWDKVVAGFRRRLGVGEVVVMLSGGKDSSPWLAGRNTLLQKLKRGTVTICEAGKCRLAEPSDFDMNGLKEALPSP
ncbi:MAG: hypothetical protein M1814_005952 [Vezdaea aestivalis]|nr:MAG: hypothetical protein M1814_005952 [Vezdaea aestivalis]